MQSAYKQIIAHRQNSKAAKATRGRSRRLLVYFQRRPNRRWRMHSIEATQVSA